MFGDLFPKLHDVQTREDLWRLLCNSVGDDTGGVNKVANVSEWRLEDPGPVVWADRPFVHRQGARGSLRRGVTCTSPAVSRRCRLRPICFQKRHPLRGTTRTSDISLLFIDDVFMMCRVCAVVTTSVCVSRVTTRQAAWQTRRDTPGQPVPVSKTSTSCLCFAPLGNGTNLCHVNDASSRVSLYEAIECIKPTGSGVLKVSSVQVHVVRWCIARSAAETEGITPPNRTARSSTTNALFMNIY